MHFSCCVFILVFMGKIAERKSDFSSCFKGKEWNSGEQHVYEEGRRKIINLAKKSCKSFSEQIVIETGSLKICHSRPCLNQIGKYSEVLKWYWPPKQTFWDQSRAAYHKGKEETNTAQLSFQARGVPKSVQTSTVGITSPFFQGSAACTRSACGKSSWTFRMWH